MPTLKKHQNIFESELGKEVLQELKVMEKDIQFNTQDSFSATSSNLPDSQISFTQKHMLYLSKHPNVDPQHYLANLRLMTKVRK